MRGVRIAIFLLGTASASAPSAVARLAAQEPEKPARDSAFERAGDELPPVRLPSDTVVPDTASAGADETITFDPTIPWQLSYFPYLTTLPNSGLAIAARVRYFQPAPYEARVTSQAELAADAGLNANGSRFITGSLRAPLVRRGWRLNALMSANRQSRFGFFGLGNTTMIDRDLDNDQQPHFYRMRRTRYRAQAEVTRRIRGPLHAALLGDVTAARFSRLPGPSVFRSTFGEELNQTDVSARLALVYDTRDTEYNTQQGLLLEAGGQLGSGGGAYERLYGVARGYLRVREGIVVAARVAASGLSGDPSLDARFTIPAWEHPIIVVGGDESHRGIDDGRLSGTGVLFGNLEVRYDLLNLGDLGALTLLGFVDAGRVFENEDFRLTLDDMEVGGGGGIAFRILRSTIFTFNLAAGAEGVEFSVGSGWMF